MIHKSKRLQEGNGGIGFFGVLFLIFLVLKLVGTISWSWWLVTLPLWGGFLFGVVLVIIVGIIQSNS